MYDWENMKVYVPGVDAEKAILRDKTDEHFYFNGTGEDAAQEVYIHNIKKSKNGNSFECDFPAVDAIATWKMV